MGPGWCRYIIDTAVVGSAVLIVDGVKFHGVLLRAILTFVWTAVTVFAELKTVCIGLAETTVFFEMYLPWCFFVLLTDVH